MDTPTIFSCAALFAGLLALAVRLPSAKWAWALFLAASVSLNLSPAVAGTEAGVWGIALFALVSVIGLWVWLLRPALRRRALEQHWQASSAMVPTDVIFKSASAPTLVRGRPRAGA